MTANSRAPEVTQFNTPRISLWPITWPYPSSFRTNAGQTIGVGDPTQPLSSDVDSNGNPWMVPKEQLLAFCATLNNDRYFFQRENPDSPSYDYTNITRNQVLLGDQATGYPGYLRTLMAQPIPGLGGSLLDKYQQPGVDYLLVNAFDFIRGSLNLVLQTTDSSGIKSIGYNFAGAGFRVTNSLAGAGFDTFQQPTSQVTPIRVSLGGTEAKGFGQFPTIVEAALEFYATERNDPSPATSATAPAGTPAANWQSSLITATQSQTTQMRMVVVLGTFLPSAPNISHQPWFWVKATGGSFKVNGTSIGFPAGNGNVIQVKNQLYINSMQFFNAFYKDRANAKTVPLDSNTLGSDANAYQTYQFVSDPITVNPNSTTFTFTGSKVTFTIYAADPSNLNADPTVTGYPVDTRVQSEVMDFSLCNGQSGAGDSIYQIPLAPRWCAQQPVPPAIATAINPATEAPYVTTVPYVDNNGNKIAGLYMASLNPNTNIGCREVSPPGQYCYEDTDGTPMSPNWQNRMDYVGGSDSGANGSPPWTITGGRVYNKGQNPATTGVPNLSLNGGGFSDCSVFSGYDTIFALDPDRNGPTHGDVRVLAGIDNPDPTKEYFKVASIGTQYPARLFLAI